MINLKLSTRIKTDKSSIVKLLHVSNKNITFIYYTKIFIYLFDLLWKYDRKINFYLTNPFATIIL